jgi:Ca2+-binding RTX toxin-like protein/glucose/arabinose dehydrogenase
MNVSPRRFAHGTERISRQPRHRRRPAFDALEARRLLAVPPAVVGPGVDPSDFRVTVFAEGLNYPYSMQQLSDESLLVATSRPNNLASPSFFNSTGELIRLVDADRNGQADGPGTVLATGLPPALTSMRVAGDLVIVTNSAGGREQITFLRAGATPSAPLTTVGLIDFNFPAGWWHTTYALAVRPIPGTAGRFDLFFNVGSQWNFDPTTLPVPVSGLITANLNGDSIYMVTVDPAPTVPVLSNLTQVATGLRNAAGIVVDPTTGDLVFSENGIDGFVDGNEPTSADELNRIPAASIGGAIENFGYPNNYIQYRTGTEIGSGGIDPEFAFQPIPSPNGSESEGPVEIAVAPRGFPAGLADGVFVGFHGRGNRFGVANEENPVVFANRATGEHFHFISNDEPEIGHLDGLLSTSDSLFASDLDPTGRQAGTAASGVIYQIQAIPNITMQEFAAEGGGSVSLTYHISGAAVGPFDIGVYRSADTSFGADTLLSTITITDPADLTSGTHTRTFNLGTAAGQVRFPGAGVGETESDHFLLAVADPRNRIREPDTHFVHDDNLVVFEGVYHVAGGSLYVHATPGADTITAELGTGLTVTVNGLPYSYPAASVARIRVLGHAGDDAIDAATMTVPLRLWGGDGADDLTGGSGRDALYGGNGNDNLVSGAGADTVEGGGGSDHLEGGADNDVYRFRAATAAEIDTILELAGQGVDALDFAALAATTGVTLNLASGSIALGSHANRTLRVAAAGQAANLENVTGGAGNDNITGNAAHNVLVGGRGNDTLGGGGGNDTLDGGADNDRMVGGTGNDTYRFLAATAAEIDTVIELLNGGVDRLNFSSLGAGVPVTVELASDTALATHINRTVRTGTAGQAAHFENATGGAGNDTINGNAANNSLVGGGGNDTLNGRNGTDTLNGGSGTDVGLEGEVLIGIP